MFIISNYTVSELGHFMRHIRSVVANSASDCWKNSTHLRAQWQADSDFSPAWCIV